MHSKLQKAARAHSEALLDKDYAAHESLNAKTVRQRLKWFGYGSSRFCYCAYGENIAWGSGPKVSPENAFDFWLNSPGDRSNILSEKLRQVGIGACRGTLKTYGDLRRVHNLHSGLRRAAVLGSFASEELPGCGEL